MNTLMQYKLLVIGIIFILAGAFLLAEANSKLARCESIGGTIVQLFDVDTKESCSQVKVMQFFSYSAIAIGIALSISNFVKRDKR